MRASRGVRYALLGMVSQSPGGIHGYALRRKCERVFGGSWRLKVGEVYRILGRLVHEKLIEQVFGGCPGTRKTYRITDRGQQSLDAFLLELPNDIPQTLRHELAVKVLFCGTARTEELLASVHHQRDVYVRELRRVGAERAKMTHSTGDAFATSLLVDGVELSIRAELAWLEQVAQKLRARRAALAASAMPLTRDCSAHHDIASRCVDAKGPMKRGSASARQLKSP